MAGSAVSNSPLARQCSVYRLWKPPVRTPLVKRDFSFAPGGLVSAEVPGARLRFLMKELGTYPVHFKKLRSLLFGTKASPCMEGKDRVVGGAHSCRDQTRRHPENMGIAQEEQGHSRIW